MMTAFGLPYLGYSNLVVPFEDGPIDPFSPTKSRAGNTE